MAEKYKPDSKCSSNKHKNISKKRNKEETKYYSKESKTPPLPLKTSMEELMKQRESIKKELKNIGNFKSRSENIMKENSRKRKYSDKSSNDFSYVGYKTFANNKNNQNNLTPDLTQDYMLDSEEEEHIIEQRRQQRKRLLEQLHTTQKDNDNKHKNLLPNLRETNDSNKNPSLTKIKSIKDTTDMFSEEDFAPQKASDNVTQDNSKETEQLKDNWDDAEGYYNIKVGDVINNQYTIKALLGQGVFANVVRAQDVTQNNTDVAIKIIRNNELMYKTGLKEIDILKKINYADPDKKYHCVQFYSNFIHKGHLCLVLESLYMDLRSILKKYGKDHGINVKALMSYSRQLILALRLLKKIGIIHADIKPDNILVNGKKNILKLCDFGSAAKVCDNEPTPYLVSRFYRAPEIILGVPYNHGVDVWSTACTIFEMATGKILFTGSSNNRMLKCFMDLKGKIPSRVLRKGKFKDQHFNYNNNFLHHKKDEFSGRDKVVEINNISITRDLCKEIKKSYQTLTNGEERKVTQLKDLLDKMLILDPNQRISGTDCLKHPFLQEDLH